MTTIIQAGVNLAYGKQATQSSDFSSTLGRARNAVDGNISKDALFSSQINKNIVKLLLPNQWAEINQPFLENCLVILAFATNCGALGIR
jgi:hypothetical protein